MKLNCSTYFMLDINKIKEETIEEVENKFQE